MDTLTGLNRFADRLGLPMATLALAWLTAQPGVTSVLVGGRNAAQMQRNLAAADVEIGPAMTAKLNEISAPLKGRMGANPDMWQSGESARIR
jgi:aryl-alcohol dehydrogenase-like predicted oxidoreductase